ncbi:hypothetical protein L6164_012398 [Bauhinia variegata]|uniref:Uncharacterized protein n=1 Tax=Bauhinia variegata TaxID=167791 RepID=A0ACB9PBF3_BAUVA|nr:hypothetical protein L6164_012398 [Bauhinia variegata]
MAMAPSPIFLILFLFPMIPFTGTADTAASCRDTCGSLQVKYPFGTGLGCGSPLFHPYISCTSNGTGDQLFLKTHTGTYPVTSISYTTSTLTITPPFMSTCTSMQTSPNFGLDWTSPFQIGSPSFILLSCPSPTSSLTINASPICDPSNNHLCAAIYTCPAVVALGLPLFPPISTCCVYSPANLNNKGELDLRSLKCGAYASVVSLEDNPTDPTHWVYGVSLKYSYGALDSNVVSSKCDSCEISGGVCGYAPPENSFVCVCKGGYNVSTDCCQYSRDQEDVWGINSSPLLTRYIWSLIAGPVLCIFTWVVFKFN